jgi:hypothetical protein
MEGKSLHRANRRRGLLVAVCAASALVAGAGAGAAPVTRVAAAPVCPLNAAGLSAIVGKKMQRVGLGGAVAASQCSFSVAGKPVSALDASPQVFFTVDPGDASGLRDLYLYYVKTRAKLATQPQIASRPDIGRGAFTLTASTAPVTTTVFLLGKSTIATLVVDLTDAVPGRRDVATAEKVLELVQNQLD